MKEKWIETLEDADLISFDVFDTMIYRVVDCPEKIFEMTGEHFRVDDFKQMRVQAQQEISKIILKSGKAPHADFEEIYQYMNKKYPQLENCREIARWEWKLEYDAAMRNPEIYEVYRKAKALGKRVIAVSDMYFHREQIKKLLEKCGYDEIDGIYCSADIKATKYEGTIFKIVQEREQVKGENILHIGDNKTSDFRNAKRAGWKSICYQPCNKGIWEKFGGEENFWKAFGCNIGGPLYAGLMEWVRIQFHNSGCQELYLLARDGYNLYQLMSDEENVHYLYTSRRALLLAGITELDEKSLKLLPPYGFGQTISEILEYLQLPLEAFEVRCAGFSSLEDKIRTEEDQRNFRKMLYLHQDIVLERCRQEREWAIKYFESAGILKGRPMIFDCGWNGSSQYLLQRVLRAAALEKEIPFLYVGILENDKSRRQLQGLPYKTYLFGKGKGKNIESAFSHAVVLPELLFGAPHSSIWYYGEQENVFENEQEQSYRLNILEGVKFYMANLKMFYKQYPEIISRKEAVKPICQIIFRPTEEEAKNIGDVENIDGFVKKAEEKKYIARLTWEQLKKNPRIEIYWIEGLKRRRDINWKVKCFVRIKQILKKILR